MRISGYVNQTDLAGTGAGSNDGIKDKFNAALLNAKNGLSCGSTPPDTGSCPSKSPSKGKTAKSKKSACGVKSTKCAKSAKSKKSAACAKSAKSNKSKKSPKSSKHC